MNNGKTFFEKYYLLLIYLCFLFTDCYLLFTGTYGYRIYAKPALVPLLLLWFMSNTAFNMRSSPQTLTSRLLIYFILLCTLAADVFGLFADKFVWTACLFLYSFTYLLYFFLVFSIQINTPEEKYFFIYVKKALPIFLIVLSISIGFIIGVLDLNFSFANFWFYLNAFFIAILGAMVANLWGVNQLKNIRILLALGVVFIIITNFVYSVDELIYHRRHRILDVVVACSNGLSQIFILLGVIKFIRYKRG